MVRSDATAATLLAATAGRGLMQSNERWSARRTVAFVVLFCGAFWIAVAGAIALAVG
jgi:hypothetical protein